MKALFFFILSGISFTALCQKSDTIRIYDYLKRAERWKLQLEGKNTFTLYSNELFTKDTVTARGSYKHDDNSFLFACDTVLDEKLGKASFRHSLFSNIQLIIKGDTFLKEKNIIVPKNILFGINSSEVIPEGFFGNYNRGDGFGSNEVELKKDGTYVF